MSTPAPPRDGDEGGRRLSLLFRALRHRNYRLFFSGQSVSLVGTWITRIATSWLVYRLTGSAAMLGLVGFTGQVPVFLLAPFAGVWIDRLDRQRVLLATQAAAMLQSLALAALTLGGIITIGDILALSALQGVISAFDTPARQAFVVQMVDGPEDMPNAIALNSSMVNAARLVGPSIAGLLIAWVGEGWCFLADGVSYLAVIASLLAMHVIRQPRRPRTAAALQELRDGFRYAASSPPIRAVLTLLALVSLAGMPYRVLMPIIAGRTLHGDAHTFGFLMGATGIGALAGAVFLASRRSVLGLGRVIPAAALTFGLGLLVLSRSRSLPLSLLTMPVVGIGFMVQIASSNTVIQTIVRDEMRGRVMSFYAMAFTGTAPFGSLLMGALAARIGAPDTMLVGAIVTMAGAAAFARALPALRQHVRPLYVERGILPEIAEGLESAASLRQDTAR